MPEIDVPGHSMAAVASYPELFGTPGNYVVLSGEKFAVFHDPNAEIPFENRLLIDNTLSPANEKVYEFLDKVFTQLAEIFPFEYIHMGGDECMKNFWRKNEAIKSLMQKEGLKSMDEVQSYFVHRLEKSSCLKERK
jgi:hexosaminidase